MTSGERIMSQWMRLVEEQLQWENTFFIHSFDDKKDTYYNRMEKEQGSLIYDVQTPKEMIGYINSIIGNEAISRCLAAKTFYDLYDYDDSMQNESHVEEPKKNVIEIPAYTYTL